MSDPMEAFRTRFRARCRADLAVLRSGPDEARRTIAHQISGVAGTLGYHDLSTLARQVDDACAANAPDEKALEDLIAAIGALPD